jgi:hypothetical protein
MIEYSTYAILGRNAMVMIKMILSNTLKTLSFLYIMIVYWRIFNVGVINEIG